MPAAVAERIEALAALANGKSLTRSAQILSEAYRTGSGAARGETDALAYTVSRMPATYAAAVRALSLSLACTDIRPETLLDAGAGTGAVTLAASLQLPIRQRICLEREPAMRALGEELTRVSGFEADWRGIDLTENKPLPSAALVTEGYMLCELSESFRMSAVVKLWEAAEEMLLLIEPGTPNGYRTIMKARRELTERGAYIAAPCPQTQVCPLPEGDWCHFSVRLSRTRRMMFAKGGEAPYEDEKFAFLACTRKEPDPCGARILRHPQINPGRIGLVLCDQNGRDERVITKKDPLWKRVRKTEWGDAL